MTYTVNLSVSEGAVVEGMFLQSESDMEVDWWLERLQPRLCGINEAVPLTVPLDSYVAALSVKRMAVQWFILKLEDRRQSWAT